MFSDIRNREFILRQMLRQAEQRIKAGYWPALLTFGNPKTEKGLIAGWRTAIMHLAPYKASGFNVCSDASEGCIKACLAFTGRARAFEAITVARLIRTIRFFSEPEAFKQRLYKEVSAHIRSSEKAGYMPAFRPNGTSDLQWERIMPELFSSFPKLQIYDYTKVYQRLMRPLPINYDLTFSLSETNVYQAEQALELGFNVAVVFWPELPKQYLGRPVIRGDLHDLRFLDNRQSIVGLLAKGSEAKADASGFVIRTDI